MVALIHFIAFVSLKRIAIYYLYVLNLYFISCFRWLAICSSTLGFSSFDRMKKISPVTTSSLFKWQATSSGSVIPQALSKRGRLYRPSIVTPDYLDDVHFCNFFHRPLSTSFRHRRRANISRTITDELHSTPRYTTIARRREDHYWMEVLQSGRMPSATCLPHVRYSSLVHGQHRLQRCRTGPSQGQNESARSPIRRATITERSLL